MTVRVFIAAVVTWLSIAGPLEADAKRHFSRTPTPTATPTPWPSPTTALSSTPSPTPAPTLTPIPPTPTNTPVPPTATATNTPLAPTPIATNTTASPTITPTRTPAPLLPTATPTVGNTPTPAPTVASSSSNGGWLVKCPLSHSLPDDPIVFPGLPGTSHMHDFAGNTTTDAFSTYASMTSNASTTTCPAASGDTSGYWIMGLLKNGVRFEPSDPKDPSHGAQFYYRKSNLNAGTVIQSFPPNFRMIAGNSHATSEADNPYLGREIYYGCSDNSESGKPKAPINCSTGIISLHVGFPNCWDGVNLDSPDHKSHVAYPSSGVCPADHPVALPRLIARTEYPVGTDSSGITLCSGPYYTAHGDFWNTWDQQKLDDLVADCLNTSTDCGTLE
jgi:hypothetical protein